ncbi:hypothetical protein HDU99_002581 [Rhizoclosmatium hyalinum]|nr:hypothetical protein HDU99_002581 [Rhizoclosmatium hyalinum]
MTDFVYQANLWETPIAGATPQHLLLAAHLFHASAPSLSRHFSRMSGYGGGSAESSLAESAANALRRIVCSVCGAVFVPGSNCSAKLVSVDVDKGKSKLKKANKSKDVSGIWSRTIALNLNKARSRPSGGGGGFGDNSGMILENDPDAETLINRVHYKCSVCSSLTVMEGAAKRDRDAAVGGSRKRPKQSHHPHQPLLQTQFGGSATQALPGKQTSGSQKSQQGNTKPLPSSSKPGTTSKTPNTNTNSVTLPTAMKVGVSSIQSQPKSKKQVNTIVSANATKPKEVAAPKLDPKQEKANKLKKMLQKTKASKGDDSKGGFDVNDFLL